MSYHCWGTDNGNTKLLGLIVSSYHEKYNEVANVVYVVGEKVLFPVPRYLYSPGPAQMTQMTKAFRDKMTTVLPPESIVSIQLDGPEETVTYMSKGNKHMFELTKEGVDWVMEVDVAVSDEPFRRVCILGLYLNPTVVETTGAIDLNSFDPEKSYKGMIKLVIYQEMVERLLNQGIRNFIDAQKHYSQAGQACFEFLLYSIYETKQPADMRVVYEAPWQTVKRSVMLTPAQVGDGPPAEDEEENNGTNLPFFCQHCEIAFKDGALYQLHRGFHSRENHLKCNICGHLSHSSLAFNLHLYQANHE